MNYKLLIMTLLSFVFLIGVSNATSPTMPSNVILNYSTITISYNGILSYSNPFQQEISLTESTFGNYIVYNKNFANFEFFNQSGAVIPSWIESNNSGTLTIWLKLNGANKLVQTGSSSATETIYLGFASKTTNLLSNSGIIGIGEAPELSSTYGQYDDGASVFNTYLNFAGNTLPTGFTSGNSSDGTFTINNGLTLETGTSDNPSYSYLLSASNTYSPQIVEFDLASVITSPSGYGGVGTDFGYSTSQPVPQSGTSVAFTYLTGSQLFSANGGFTNNLYNSGTEITSNSGSLTSGIYGTEINPLTLYENYNIELTSSTSTTSNNYLLLGIDSPGSSAGRPESEEILIYWFRTRAEVPNNLMPSATFSAVQSSTTSTPPPVINIDKFYFTANSITYGNYPVIFYNISNIPATLNLALQSTNSIVYTFTTNSLSGTQTLPQFYGAGNYIFYLEANNILSNTLTINQIPISSFSVSQKSFTYNGVPPSIVITPNTINNQIPSYSYTLTSANAGNYLVSHTFSNKNYSATTYSTNIIINKAYPFIYFYKDFNSLNSTGPARFNPHNLYFITFNGFSYNNQLNFSIYLNDNFIISTNSIYTYNITMPDFYDFVMNESGNSNYYPFSNSTGFMLQSGTMNYQINIPNEFPAILSYGNAINFSSGNTIEYTSNGPVSFPNYVNFNISKVANTSIYPWTANNLQQIYNFTKINLLNITLPVGNYLIQFSNMKYLNSSYTTLINGTYYPVEIKPALPKFIFKLSSSAIGSVVLNNANQTYKLYATTKQLPITITANLSTIGNQLQGEVLLNGNVISTTSTTFSYTITQSNYKPNMLFEFKSNGNYNYTAFDPAFDILFVKSSPPIQTIQNFTAIKYEIYNGSNKIILFNQVPSNTSAKLYSGYVLPPSSQTGLYTPANAMQYYNYKLVATSSNQILTYNAINLPAGTYLFKLTTITNTTINQSIVISTKNYYLTYYIEKAIPQFLNGVLETSNTIFGNRLKVYYNSSKVVFPKMPLNLTMQILPINKIIEFPANENISIGIIPNGSVLENGKNIYNFSTPQSEIGNYSFILNGIANNNYTIPNKSYEINTTISLPTLNSTLSNNNIVIGSEKGFDNLTLTESDNYDMLELFEGNTLLAKSTSPLNYNLYNLIPNNTNTNIIKLYAIDKSFPEINKTFIVYLYKPAYMINGRIITFVPNVIAGNVLDINFTNVSSSLVYSMLLLNLTGNQTIKYEGFGNMTLTMETNNNETEFISGVLTYQYGNETNFYNFNNFSIRQGKLKRLVISINPSNVILINKLSNNTGIYNSIIIIAVIILAVIIVLWKVINILIKKDIL